MAIKATAHISHAEDPIALIRDIKWQLAYNMPSLCLDSVIDPLPVAAALRTTLCGATFWAWIETSLADLLQAVTKILIIAQEFSFLIILFN